jgi:hypothetical protein
MTAAQDGKEPPTLAGRVVSRELAAVIEKQTGRRLEGKSAPATQNESPDSKMSQMTQNDESVTHKEGI